VGTLRLSLALGPVPYAEAIGRAERLGFRSIMLRYSPERDTEDLGAIKRLAADRGLELPLINGYTNLIHPDPVTLAANRDIFVRAMETALALGAGWTNTIIGTRDPGLSFWEYHPDNFSVAAWDCAAESIRYALDRFPDERVGMTLEPYLLTTLASPAKLREMIDQVGSPRVKVLFEPVNLIGPNEYWRQNVALPEMIRQLGPLIVAVHAKDHYLQRRQVTLHIEERVPGRGELDYSTLLTELAKLPQEPIVTIEHLGDDADIREAKAYITGVAERCRVTLI